MTLKELLMDNEKKKKLATARFLSNMLSVSSTGSHSFSFDIVETC